MTLAYFRTSPIKLTSFPFYFNRVTTRLIHQRKTTDNIFGPNKFGICLYSDQGKKKKKNIAQIIMVVAIVVYNSLYETLY